MDTEKGRTIKQRAFLHASGTYRHGKTHVSRVHPVKGEAHGVSHAGNAQVKNSKHYEYRDSYTKLQDIGK